MFNRIELANLREALSDSPAVAILGARQVGKTTLAKQVAAERGHAVYLDLENPDDLAQLAQPTLFLRANRDKLLVLDEVQSAPDLFSVLRGEIDADRRPGRFLLLGSASFELLRQSQSLAGRLALIDMQPLLLSEVAADFPAMQTMLLRGGFPLSYTARNDAASAKWRDDFIRHFLETDLRNFGFNLEPEAMRRFWRMLAHWQGQLFNASELAKSLGVSPPTVSRWLDHLVHCLVVRKLEPMHANLGKRLVKSPRVYVRDCGLLHSLLGHKSTNDLLGAPGIGAAWEGLCIEQIAGHLGRDALLSFYRTAAGAEMDLVAELSGKRYGFEFKFSTTPKLSKGFWHAREDIGAQRCFVVAPVTTRFPFADGVEVVSPLDLPALLADL
jgi:uncharacterized protein